MRYNSKTSEDFHCSQAARRQPKAGNWNAEFLLRSKNFFKFFKVSQTAPAYITCWLAHAHDAIQWADSFSHAFLAPLARRMSVIHHWHTCPLAVLITARYYPSPNSRRLFCAIDGNQGKGNCRADQRWRRLLHSISSRDDTSGSWQSANRRKADSADLSGVTNCDPLSPFIYECNCKSWS